MSGNSIVGTKYVTLFLIVLTLLGAAMFFGQYALGDTNLSKILTAGGVTLLALLVFFVMFWAFRGFPPGSRLIVGELSTENDLLTDEATFIFFYTQWCPYSQQAKPKVEALGNTIQDFTYGGKRVTVNLIDCEQDKNTCRKYAVSAYPTYKLITASKVYEYSGPPRAATYEEFLITALGKKVPRVSLE